MNYPRLPLFKAACLAPPPSMMQFPNSNWTHLSKGALRILTQAMTITTCQYSP